MEERTRAYLRGRFRDYYRRTEVTPPPDASSREWGYIPWTAGPGTTMVRHRSLLDLGDLGEFLHRERPQHVYFSGGRYGDPGASTMETKGWRDADLVFDLDADHLPSVALGEDSYGEMLEKCKRELDRLLAFLADDFAFEDVTVVFSGGRGYHVHVRDEGVRRLGSDERREIVDYVRGTGISFDAIVERELVGGTAGRTSPAEKRTLPTHGGWGRRVHARLLGFVEELSGMERDDALARVREYDGFGERKAEAILRAAESSAAELREGNTDVHPAVVELARRLTDEVAESEHAHIDEPVTTDVNRLIRLPDSLHGGTGLRVVQVPADELAAFDPLTEAIPETFRGQAVRIDVADGGRVEFDGQTFTVEPGETSVPEFVAVFLMARGRAEKAKE